MAIQSATEGFQEVVVIHFETVPYPISAFQKRAELIAEAIKKYLQLRKELNRDLSYLNPQSRT